MSSRFRWSRLLLSVAGLSIAVGLAIFFVRAASEHASRINNFKARGDQSGYLYDAKNIYFNFHGDGPKALIGERNRMPIYAGYLALFYKPVMTDLQYFEVAKRANIYLAVGSLAILGLFLWWHLPPLPAVNLLGIVTFGWFIYKAGYTQSELLFYTFFFLAFLACWHLLRTPPSPRLPAMGVLAGLLCALAYLTKASMPPFIALFGGVVGARALVGRLPGAGNVSRVRVLAWSAATLLLFATTFVAVTSPYLATNKRHFGRYFYNVNSTFYAWYDDWASASVGVRLHGDNIGWPDVPPSEMPSAQRYLREHTVAQIASRVWSGIKDMAIVSYRTYDYLGWLLLYTALLAAIASTRRTLFAGMIRDHFWLAAFLAAYGVLHVLATAFYFPISGTGTGRFLIAHLLPYFFVLTHLFSRSRLAGVDWSVGGLRLRVVQFHWLVLALLVLDISFRTWPRVMTTYGGF